jgi:hypothetical protein
MWRRAVAACFVVGLAASLMMIGPEAHPTRWMFADNGRYLYPSERVRAGAEPVQLESDGFGTIELQPGSEIRLIESSPGLQRMRLERGRLHAFIWAPPRQFVVDTPSARAVDLGCQYELSVDDRGDGFLRVQTGWVAFQAGSIESFIPAGAACRTQQTRGPGIPYFEDAPQQFRSALETFERRGSVHALSTVLENARPEDGLTLWHLLNRVDRTERGAVFDRLARLVTLPVAVEREKAVAGDPETLDLCWGALQLEDAGWWREWKRDWR